MQFLIINQYSNTKLRKIIYSTDQFSRQLKSVAAYILRQRQHGSSTRQVTRMEINIQHSFKIKQRLVRNNLKTTYKRKPQVVYQITKECEIDIPRSTLRLSELAYKIFFNHYKDGRLMAEDPIFIKSLYSDKQLCSAFRSPFQTAGILKFEVEDRCKQQMHKYRMQQLSQKQVKRQIDKTPVTSRKLAVELPYVNVSNKTHPVQPESQSLVRTSKEQNENCSLRPNLPEKTSETIAQNQGKSVTNVVFSDVNTETGIASRRESINMEQQSDREIVDARADSNKNTSVNFLLLGCVFVLVLSVLTSLHTQPKVFAMLFISNACFFIFLLFYVYASFKLIRLAYSKL